MIVIYHQNNNVVEVEGNEKHIVFFKKILPRRYSKWRHHIQMS